MKKFKQLVTGVVIGGVLASTGVVFASGQVNFVNYEFKFNGVQKPVPEGYTVLEYQDRTYVPARFVAENMGGTVEWDENSKTVIIKNNGITKAELNELGQNVEIVRYVSFVNELDDLMFTTIRIATDPQNANQVADLTKRIDEKSIQSWQQAISQFAGIPQEDKDAFLSIANDLINAKKQVLSSQREAAWNSTSKSKQVSNNLWNKYDRIVQDKIRAGLSR